MGNRLFAVGIKKPTLMARQEPDAYVANAVSVRCVFPAMHKPVSAAMRCCVGFINLAVTIKAGERDVPAIESVSNMSVEQMTPLCRAESCDSNTVHCICECPCETAACIGIWARVLALFNWHHTAARRQCLAQLSMLAEGPASATFCRSRCPFEPASSRKLQDLRNLCCVRITL